MGSGSSKEEVIIAQNAAGGSNQATVEEIKMHISTMNLILIIMLTVMLLGVLYAAYRMYKKCHLQWIDQQFHQHALRRSVQRRISGSRPRAEEHSINMTVK